jgi:serine/threonine protein kinase/tetratricopeptide (TPR) repeat protein
MSPSTNFTGPPTTNWPGVPASDQATCQNQQLDLLADRIIAEMTAAWNGDSGSRPVAEDYFAQHPEISLHTPVALRVIMAELALRQHHGQTVAQRELVRRFPAWHSQLEALLASERFQSARPRPQFPEVGEVLGGFKLLAELGRGAKGVVYLAKQTTLADRPVVLKMTSWEGQEHLSLARLQHTNIVPLYDVFEFPTHGLRALCMPYLGGLALDSLLRRLQERAQPLSQRRGQDLIELVDAAQESSAVKLPRQGGGRELLSRATYVEAICWIGACLGDALQYAHERGLLHLDIKPGNVLLASDGTPLLLDFHLAHEPITPDSPRPPWFGGTPDYMSPEQRAVLVAVSARRPIPNAVDGRSDIYSLGILLYEALGNLSAARGRHALPLLHGLNPEVSIGLSDVIARCIAAESQDRYDSAGALAEDLRRHLAGLPLQGVANRSWPERWLKWRQRKPHALGRYALMGAAALGLLIGAGVVGTLGSQHWNEAQQALSRTREAYHRGDFVYAKETAEQGLAHFRYLPVQLSGGLQTLHHDLLAEHELCTRAVLGSEIHQLAEALRRLNRFEAVSKAERERLQESCQKMWDLRWPLLVHRPLRNDGEFRNQLLADLLEIALTADQLRILNVEKEAATAARQEALGTLDELERLNGHSPVFAALREQHHRALGQPQQAEAAAKRARTMPVHAAWEAYRLGRMAMDRGDLEAAAAAFGKAVKLSEGDFWSHFYRGLVNAKLGRHQDTLREFDICVALRPDVAECWFNRGLAHETLSNYSQALDDYAKAGTVKEDYADAWLNRGLLLLRLDRDAEALDQLLNALEGGAEPFAVHFALARAHQKLGNRPEALASVKRALHLNPDSPEAKALLRQLEAQQ